MLWLVIYHDQRHIISMDVITNCLIQPPVVIWLPFSIIPGREDILFGHHPGVFQGHFSIPPPTKPWPFWLRLIRNSRFPYRDKIVAFINLPFNGCGSRPSFTLKIPIPYSLYFNKTSSL